jgi:hypothetical protein
VPDPKSEYNERLDLFLKAAETHDRAHLQIGYGKLAVLAAGLVVLWCIFARHWLSPWWLAAPIVAYGLFSALHGRILAAKNRALTAANFYRRGIARIEDRWTGSGQTGERFRNPDHVYADDLDLFGRGCLFELLSTARLPMGENRLAAWLSEGSPLEEVLERQQLIQELRKKVDLREDLAVMGEELGARLDPEKLIAWAEAACSLPGGVWRWNMGMLALCAGVAGVYYLSTAVLWPLLAIFVVEAGILYWLRRKAHAVIEAVECNAEGLLLFSEILERLEREPFAAARLRGFVAELKQEGAHASHALRRFAGVEYWIEASDGVLAKMAELPFLYSVQVAMAAEAWRRRFGAKLRRWVEIAGEMEALLSLSAYTYEHPDDPFPEFAPAQNGVGLFEGDTLGHPLIARAVCVRNSVCLDLQTRVMLVSGSNMSGKSTFLRTVGINTVLAMAGAPIRGKRLRLTALQIGTRIRSTDSLQEGRSSFFTEILHIRKVFERANGTVPLIFLFDELLEGTNSKDRRIGAEGLLQGLLKRRAIGVVTTHDLALTEISAGVGKALRNMHFEDQVAEGKMRFDYKLREGVVEKSNALELMRLIGLET